MLNRRGFFGVLAAAVVPVPKPKLYPEPPLGHIIQTVGDLPEGYVDIHEHIHSVTPYHTDGNHTHALHFRTGIRVR